MPIYEYECSSCGKVFEEWNKSFDDVESPCSCGKTARRIVSNTAFVLKGSGWYVTDYNGKKSSGGNGNGDGASDSTGAPESKTDAAPAADAGKSSATGVAADAS